MTWQASDRRLIVWGWSSHAPRLCTLQILLATFVTTRIEGLRKCGIKGRRVVSVLSIYTNQLLQYGSESIRQRWQWHQCSLIMQFRITDKYELKIHIKCWGCPLMPGNGALGRRCWQVKTSLVAPLVLEGDLCWQWQHYQNAFHQRCFWWQLWQLLFKAKLWKLLYKAKSGMLPHWI